MTFIQPSTYLFILPTSRATNIPLLPARAFLLPYVGIPLPKLHLLIRLTSRPVVALVQIIVLTSEPSVRWPLLRRLA